MKIIVTKENLSAALRKALCAISSKVVIPSMANVLFSADGDKLTITSTDNEITIITQVPALIEEEGQTTLPAKKLAQVIAALPNGDVTIESDADDLSKINCMKNSTTLHGLSAIDYPNVKPLEPDWTFKMKGKDLVRGLTKVVYARSTDDTRKQLNGVVMSIRAGMMTMAATDGRRLALLENTLEDENAKDGDYILPSRASTEISRCMDDAVDDITIGLNKSGVIFESKNTKLVTKLVEGSYPNFRQVIPENCGATITVPRTVFMEVLSRVSIVVLDTSGSIKLTFGADKLNISAYSPETGESSESMETAYEGEEVTVSFNPLFFLDPLKVMECDKVNIEFGKQYTPVKLTGDDGFLYMLMPMRS